MTAKHFIENNIYILHLLAQARSKMLATVLPQDLNKYQSGILSLKKNLSDTTNLWSYRKHLTRVKVSGKKKNNFSIFIVYF